jgi:outer membrane protein assembly complex protein YaeT
MRYALHSRVLPLSLFLTVTLSLSQALPSVTIREIRIAGNHALHDDQILNVMVSKLSRDYQAGQLSVDQERILRRYRQEGYCFTEVNIQSRQLPDDTSHVDVIVTVHEGPQAVIGNITLQGNSTPQTSTILEAFETRVGNVLDPTLLERDIRLLISRYERIGYPYAAINVSDISLIPTDSSQQLRILLTIDEGAKITINEVRVQGNKETSEHVIVREARVAPPEIYDEEKVSKIQQRLNRLNIFSSVHEPELYVNREGGGLLISVEESNTNTFDGVIGYVPGGQNDEGGVVTGMVNVVMRNLFGTARKLDVRWQRDDRYSQEIGVRYVEPWVFDIPVNLGGNFFQRQQDTIYVRRVVGFNGEMMFSDVFTVGGLLQQENIIPSTTLATQAVSNSRTLTAGITLRYDTRDDIINPTSGVNYRTDYLFGSKKIYSTPFVGVPGNSTVQKLSIDAEAYVEPIERQVIALGLHGRQITSDNIEVSDRFRFGGTNTLRGYRENQFLGSRIAWTNTEYRFLLARRSFFFGFFDTGYYFIPADDQHGIPSSQSVKYGYGVGVRVETSLGNIGVSIALGEGDSFSQAKLHFGLINQF